MTSFGECGQSQSRPHGTSWDGKQLDADRIGERLSRDHQSLRPTQAAFSGWPWFDKNWKPGDIEKVK
jgi:hypothetical protein